MALVESFSGIRGIFPKELSEEVVSRYAYAFSTFLKDKNKKIKLVIGTDTRKSCALLKEDLIEAVECDIIDVGVLPTAAIENAIREYHAIGGIIVTASHNEPEYNGLKFLRSDGAIVRPKEVEQIMEIYKSVRDLPEDEFLQKLGNNNVKHIEIGHIDAKQKYINFILRFFSKQDLSAIRKTKIVCDPNGGTGILAKEIFDKIKINAVYVNMEEGIFKRKIEPTEDSLQYLGQIVKQESASLAAGFDCDADRVELVLDDGALVSGNQILALITRDILSRQKNPEKQTVVVNDATSYLVKQIVDEYKANWSEVEVGEVNVIDTMIEFNSPVGGEGSNGGVIIPPSRCRDGILTLLYLLKIIGASGKNAKQLIDGLPKYNYYKEKIKISKDFAQKKEKIKQFYLKRGFQVVESGDETGGLKAIKDNAWVWFRQSKTEDKILRIISDSINDKLAVKNLKDAKQLLRK